MLALAIWLTVVCYPRRLLNSNVSFGKYLIIKFSM